VPYGLSESGEFLGGMNSLQMLFDDRVYQHLFVDTLRCIDINTGDILWVSGPEKMAEEEYKSARRPDRYLGCADALYYGREYISDGHLQARRIEDGRVLWRVDAPDARMFLTAGDLLFGALGDVPVAWDRHTGEVVWRADQRMTAVYNAVAAGNKVIYSNTMSQMRCYEWDMAYISTARR
jgi:outer membrane protein assembly factor BamB